MQRKSGRSFGRSFGRKPPKLNLDIKPGEPIDYKNLEYLQRFLTPQGAILSRRRTGFCAQCQRQLKKAIKRSRHLALFPFVG